MGKRYLFRSVMAAAYERMLWVYKKDYLRPIVAFSGGKDSGVVLELAVMAATETGRLPVEVAFCDEEALFPGTEEYLLRTAERPEIKFHWLLLTYPQVNIYNRDEPYWWLFDDRLSPDQWVRVFPKWARWVPEVEIATAVNYYTFPDVEYQNGQRICKILGIRSGESRNRLLAVYSARSFWVWKNQAVQVWPIYDWNAGDVWKAVKEFGWDYNRVYDDWTRMRVKAHHQKVAPPAMMPSSFRLLRAASYLWPRWFDKLCERLPGVREGVRFGNAFLSPRRRLNETWEQAYHRLVLGPDNPQWIRERGEIVMKEVLRRHAKHSKEPFPDGSDGCPVCAVTLSSWAKLTDSMFMGDPFCYRQKIVGLVEPEYFRPGYGTWRKGISLDKMPKWASKLDTYEEILKYPARKKKLIIPIPEELRPEWERRVS